MTEKLGFNTQLEQDIFKRIPKIAKATVSLIVSVCPSVHPYVCMEELGFQWTDFHEIYVFF